MPAPTKGGNGMAYLYETGKPKEVAVEPEEADVLTDEELEEAQEQGTATAKADAKAKASAQKKAMKGPPQNKALMVSAWTKDE